MSTVVVTGGAGRLGRSVIEALAAAGHTVVSIDRTHRDETPAVQIDLDLSDAEATMAAFLRIRPAVVVHLAAIAVPFSAPESEILRINLAIAWNVIDAAVAAGATGVLAASSPTVVGYGAPTGWTPRYLPLDEEHPVRPWNAYALSKLTIEAMIDMVVARDGDSVGFGVFRPCFVIAPEEWAGAPTQQGHTVRERLDDPALAAGALFNYVDARDAAAFVVAWIARGPTAPNGSVFFVGAADALAREPLSTLLPRHVTGTQSLASGLVGSAPAFSLAKAEALLGWTPTRSWRTELVDLPAHPPSLSLPERVGMR